MLGIVIPAHNEQNTIAACVQAARHAATHPTLDEPVEIIVVLDGCTDATGVIAARSGAITISVRARNVGVARSVGAEVLLARGARWLGFTDADTMVAPGWLADQLSLDADAVCGTVGVEDWTPHGIHADLLHRHFLTTYRDNDGHRHVHGANLGVSAMAYRRAGGFRHLGCDEDVEFVRALEASGAKIAWSAKPRVVTSARREARARGGFADALLNAVVQHLNPATLTTLASP
ncbi:glycosyltransferase [Variovorax sp. GT1P44]|uniref:glycosyltransferase n=1 Tax=Variovorax sp. GT1P44 TaxID=3443742 RepID=UPI003F48FF82